jgi:hypothetical protein
MCSTRDAEGESRLLELIDELTVASLRSSRGRHGRSLQARQDLGTEADGRHRDSRPAGGGDLQVSSHLRSITQGRGMHAAKVSHYEEVPREQSDRVIAAAKAEKEAAAHA